MALTPSIKISTQMPYRGGTKTYSNRFHFTGGTPADLSHWNTLADNVVAIAKTVITTDCSIVEATYYAAGSDLPLGSKSYSTAGTFSLTGRATVPGDCAAMMRWSTAARSSKNHPVYLYSWIHRPTVDNSSDGDGMSGALQTLLQTYASDWLSGFSDGSITCVRAGPNGASATGYSVDSHIRHRDFPT